MLVNDSYANFRFSKRANEVLSPLSKTKYGFTLHKSAAIRKMSMTNTSKRPENLTMKPNDIMMKAAAIGDMTSKLFGQTAYARLGPKDARQKSLLDDHGLNSDDQIKDKSTIPAVTATNFMSARRTSKQPNNFTSV